MPMVAKHNRNLWAQVIVWSFWAASKLNPMSLHHRLPIDDWILSEFKLDRLKGDSSI